MNKKIPYEASISATKNQFCPRMRITKEGMQLLNDLMNSINSSLVQAFDQEYDSARKINTDTSLKCAQKAVSKVFPPEFRQLAIAQGTSDLMMYRQGELEYDFSQSVKELKSSQQPVKKSKPATVKPMIEKFVTAVAKVNGDFGSTDVRLDPKAKKLLAIYLYKLTSRLASRAADNVPDGSQLRYDHIVSVLPEFLSSSILQLAHSEGSRNMNLHVQGIDVFNPRKITSQASDIMNDPILRDEGGDASDSFPLEPSVLRAGIKKLQPDISLKFDPSLALNVSQVANCLIPKVKKQMEQENLEEIDFMHLAIALRDIFPQNILDHAALRASSMVEDYIKGLFTYKKRAAVSEAASPSKKRKIGQKSATPKKGTRKSSGKKSQKRRKTSKSDGKKRPKGETAEEPAPKKSRKVKLDFSKEILEIFVKTFALKAKPSVSINRSGVAKLNTFLIDVLGQIVQDCENETTLKSSVVRAMVEKYFPGELFRHARGAGARKLMMAGKDTTGKQTDANEASSSSATKPKEIASEDTNESGTTNADDQSENASTGSSHGSEDYFTGSEAAESEAAGNDDDENEPNDDSPNVKKEVKSQESVGAEADDANDKAE